MLVWGLVGACIDEPVAVPPPGSSVGVDRLSQLGLFDGELAALQPRAGVVPYDVNVALYADGADKRRFFVVPPGAALGATDDRLAVPVGTYFVKNFFYLLDERDPSAGRKLIETRILVEQAHGSLLASTYVWNDAQTDAIVSGGNVDVQAHWIDASGAARAGFFHVPGVSQCQDCHANRTLGIRDRQLDKGNQLSDLVAMGVIDAQPPAGLTLVDPFGSASLDARARSYLDANCAHCHAPGASAGFTSVYWDYEHTAADQLPTCRAAKASVGGASRVLVPGDPAHSSFLTRMRSSDPWARMPQGPVHVPDAAAIAMLSQWVDAMTPAGCP